MVDSTRGALSKSFAIMVMLSLVGVCAGSCAFRRLKADVETARKQLHLSAVLDADVIPEGQIVLVVYLAEDDDTQVAAFKIVDPKVKRVGFVLDPGVYRLGVFHDKNSNLILDAAEPSYLANRGRRLKFSDVNKRIALEISLPDEKDRPIPRTYPRDLATLPNSIQNIFHRAVGDIIDPADRKFSKQAGKMGLWEPARFLKKYGAGIYMLDAYDPEKTPVLFIGGAGGNLSNFDFFFDHFDKERFQVWYTLYPSGMRISVLGKGLNLLIRDMANKFCNKRLHIVAHSMGGLVAREAIVQHIKDGGPVFIDQFVTISTPWNGHAMAARGVKSFFTPVPSWHDVVPGSAFLQTVFKVSIKEQVDHHLLFGFVTGSDEDGSVALSSVLLAEAQNDAVEVHGFEGTHVGVLSMDVVFEHVENILLDADGAYEACSRRRSSVATEAPTNGRASSVDELP